jgi:nicotinate phosphoribosyltransferase
MTAFANVDDDKYRYQNPELNLCPENYSLLTDLYQLTMAACYTGEGIEQKRASFELFVRRLRFWLFNSDGFGASFGIFS